MAKPEVKKTGLFSADDPSREGFIKIHYTGSGVMPLRGESVGEATNCLERCNNQVGPCPNYCGEHGYCLVTGLTLIGDMFYTCVVLHSSLWL